ncbi:MAG: hypothetical protein EBR82_00530 [Caulobacteraceae bacterium]|jgi:formiminotetrahydrofolate cyclodeaminase|nr:hypothetical protein [Caulobacteraceae bacterium]
MDKSDNIVKESRILVDSVKDTLASNLLSAVRSSMVSLPESDLNKLINIVNLSVDEAYQKALPIYHRAVKKHT